MKPQKVTRHVMAFVAAMLFVTGSYAQGPVRAMYFPGTGVLNSTNNFVDLGMALEDSLATTSFTIEMWVKMGPNNTVNPVLIGDKDWASGSNTGFVLSYYASTDASSGTAHADTIRFNFKPAGSPAGTRVDYDMNFPASIAQKWNHIAITVNRSGSIIGYLNGVQAGGAFSGTGSISADAGKTIAGTLPIRLGTDGKVAGYRAPLNASMDEVRIWKSVRTQQQIKDNMCHKLAGTETGLLAYYNMDEASDTIVYNRATATSTLLFNGIIHNSAVRVASGAPFGDTSVNVYATTWTGQSLSLTTTNRGIFKVDSIVKPGSYLHLYQINAVPDSTNGLTAYSNNNVYFGTFASGDSMRYYTKYDYNNYSNALSFKQNIGFFTRVYNADPTWSAKTTLYNDTVNHLMRVDSVSGTHQFFLANFISTCNIPTSLAATNITYNSAKLGWTTGGASLWNVQYGVSGFTLGTGTTVTAVNTNPYTLGSLLSSTTYQYYVQDSCVGLGTSAWAGPFSFTTAQTPCSTAPSALAATNMTANTATLSWTTGGASLWNIQYGVTGFTPGTGTMVKGITTNPDTLNGLLPNTAYQFYVQDSCAGIGTSIWTGPFSFTTISDLSAFGSGYAMHFNGSGVQNSTVQAVKLATNLRDSLATTNFTIEMWIRIGTTNLGNPPFIADKDYTSGANAGICWTYTGSVLHGDAAAHAFRFNITPVGGSRHDYDMTAANEYTWNHIAITVDRKGFIMGYINGVEMPSSYTSNGANSSIAVDSTKTLVGAYPFWLGTDGTGNYTSPLNADMDEVRIWKTVRTQQQIRDNMCHKLAGTETGLLAYYRLDESSGTGINNSAIATTGLFGGTTSNSPAHIISSAPIGDTSVNIYPASGWAGTSLSLSTVDKGTVTIDSITSTNVPGIHLYSVKSAPNFQDGIDNIGTTNKYVGVFTPNNTTASYRVQYDYSNYATAVSNNSNLHLYNRPDNAAVTWTQLPASHNTATHVFSKTQSLGYRQYLLADFTPATCTAPTNILTDSTVGGNAALSWTSSAADHKIQYGLAGFVFNSATATVVTANHQQLNNLAVLSGYEFYIQDSCGVGSTSAWVGPYYFTTSTTNVYYSAASGNLNSLATFGSNTDGSGLNPSDFTSNGKTYHITNGHPGTLSAPWVVSGIGSKIIVDTSFNITQNVTAKITVSPGQSISIASGKTLITNDSLVLLQGARIGTVAGTITGNVVIPTLFSAQRGYRLIGHPYTAGHEVTIADLGNYFDVTGIAGGNIGPDGTPCPSTNPSTYTYTPGVSPAYVGITNSATAIPAAQSGVTANGILAFVRGGTGGAGCSATTPYTVTAATMYTAGPVNQGAITETVPAGGWNLISNPYPSPMAVSSISNYNASGITFVSVSPSQQNGNNNYTNGTAYAAAGASTVLPINGAVLVFNASGSDVALGFTENAKTAAAPTTDLLKNTNTYPELELSVYHDNAFWDSWQMMLQPGTGNMSGDIGDLAKLSNAQFDIYSLSADSKSLYRDARDADSIADGDIVYLGLNSTLQTTYTLQVSGYDLPANKTVYLHDKYTRTYVQINNGVSYSFSVTADTASQGQNRLELIFNTNNSNTGIGSIANNANSDIIIAPNPATSNINVSYSNTYAGIKDISIMNVLGQVVKQVNTREQLITIPVNDLAGGVYLIKTTINGKSVTRRFTKN